MLKYNGEVLPENYNEFVKWIYEHFPNYLSLVLIPKKKGEYLKIIKLYNKNDNSYYSQQTDYVGVYDNNKITVYAETITYAIQEYKLLCKCRFDVCLIGSGDRYYLEWIKDNEYQSV